jgi:hypothetical protein
MLLWTRIKGIPGALRNDSNQKMSSRISGIFARILTANSQWMAGKIYHWSWESLSNPLTNSSKISDNAVRMLRESYLNSSSTGVSKSGKFNKIWKL